MSSNLILWLRSLSFINFFYKNVDLIPTNLLRQVWACLMHCILRYWHSKLQVSHKLTLSFCFPTWLDVALFLKLNSRGHSLQPSKHPSCFNLPKERVKLHKFTHKLTLHMCFIFPLSFLRLVFKSHSLTHCLAKPWLYIHLILLLSKIEDTHCIPNPKHVVVHCFSLLRWRFSRFLLFFFFNYRILQ